MSLLDRLFKLRENETTVGTEIRAGIVTFLTMSYILFVQPIVLSSTGLSSQTVFIATCVASAATTILMAFLANYPIALAPAMGHNFLFAYYCREGLINWQTGLGVLVISGSLFILMSFWGIREKIVTAVPTSLKHAIAVGIGLLIAFVGFQWAGLAVGSEGTLVRLGNLHARPVLLALGGLVLTAALIALKFRGAILFGILATAIAGIPLGITSTAEVRERGILNVPRREPMKQVAVLAPAEASTSQLGALFTALHGAAETNYERGKVILAAPVQQAAREAGFVLTPTTTPEDIVRFASERLKCGLVLVLRAEAGKKEPMMRAVAYDVAAPVDKRVWRTYHAIPQSASAGTLSQYAKDVILGLPGHAGSFRFDVAGAISIGLIHVIFIFFFLDLFDTIGTLIGVAQQGGFMRDGKVPRASGVLLSDAIGTVIGAAAGTSTITSYIESSAGVAEGGRTGLASVVTAIFLLLSLFLAPLVEMIGGGYGGLHPAVAPVLIIIGSIMLRNVVHISWSDPTEALPAFLAIMMMPLTLSITEGIAFGFISFSFLKLITGRGREVHWLVYLFSTLFIVRYACVGT